MFKIHYCLKLGWVLWILSSNLNVLQYTIKHTDKSRYNIIKADLKSKVELLSGEEYLSEMAGRGKLSLTFLLAKIGLIILC